MPYFVNVLVSHIKRSQAVRLILVGAVCLLVGAALFSATQRISFPTALYWALETATTVGYGDVAAKNPTGRAVAVGVMLTTIPLFASAFALLAGAVVTTNLRKLMVVAHPEALEDEVAIYGWSPVVPRVADQLIEAGRPVVVIANTDRENLPDAVRFIAADPTSEEAVRRSHPEKASQLLITARTDADVLVTAVLLRRVAADVPKLAVVGSGAVGTALAELGVDATISSEDLLVNTLARSLEAPHAGELLLRLVYSDDYQMKELPVDSVDQGRALASIRKEHQPGLVLGAVHDGHVIMGVAHDVVVEEGDQLIVLEPAPS
ncbi:MAG: ion channel [Acidimicrobiaceae bacterium]|nr:ion channel [Acidimicrobiaceae bacterium]